MPQPDARKCRRPRGRRAPDRERPRPHAPLYFPRLTNGADAQPATISWPRPLALPAAAGIDGRFAEPTWLRVTSLDLHSQPACRFVHFSDLHYKGDAGYATKVAGTINALAPEFVCFMGDLVEDACFAPAALDFIRQIARPVYGCPGNWDYNRGANFRNTRRPSERLAARGWWIAVSC